MVTPMDFQLDFLLSPSPQAQATSYADAAIQTPWNSLSNFYSTRLLIDSNFQSHSNLFKFTFSSQSHQLD